MFEDSR